MNQSIEKVGPFIAAMVNAETFIENVWNAVKTLKSGDVYKTSCALGQIEVERVGQHGAKWYMTEGLQPRMEVSTGGLQALWVALETTNVPKPAQPLVLKLGDVVLCAAGPGRKRFDNYQVVEVVQASENGISYATVQQGFGRGELLFVEESCPASIDYIFRTQENEDDEERDDDADEPDDDEAPPAPPVPRHSRPVPNWRNGMTECVADEPEDDYAI